MRLATRIGLVSLGLIALSFCVLAPSAAWAQTTGRITGRIADSTGGALPGVTVTVAGPALQGTRTSTTDATGEYRFANLPPGVYIVKAELTGFKAAEQQDVRVGIDRVAQVDLQLSIGGVSEVVNVSAAATMVDTTSAAAGINATPEVFNRLPTRRDFYAVAQLAPGVSSDLSGTTMAGSTGAENSYIIEGLNTTNARFGTQGKILNWDFVDEVEVKTGGLPAEYGRMTGGVINVVTKSGGNSFHGSGFGFFEGGPLYAGDKTQAQRPAGATTVTNLDRLWDVGFSVGGFILKDKLWFFGAYNPTRRDNNVVVIQNLGVPGAPALGAVIPTQETTHQLAGKLTYRLGQNQTLVFSAFGDPNNYTGPIDTNNGSGIPTGVAGPPSTWLGTRTGGGTDFVGRYNATFGSKTLVSLLYGYHVENQNISGEGTGIPLSLDQTVTPNLSTGGFGYFENQRFTRKVLKGDFSRFVGAHEIKVGGDYESVAGQVDRYQGGAGQIVYKLIDNGTIYYRHRYYVNDQAAGFNRDDPATWQIVVPLTVGPQSKNYSVFAQDTWRLARRLTINAGLRWERQEDFSRSGAVALELKQNWAPRLGVVWDVEGNGRSKLYANWGRFYESIPQDITVRSFGGEVMAFSYNFSPNPANYLPVPGTPSESTLLGGSTEPVDPNLKGQYIDEFLVGYERELRPSLSVGIKYAHRSLGRVIEDFLVPSEGTYFIANPSEGALGQQVAFINGGTAPAPAPKRVYNSVELKATKRYSNGWQMLASYTWSRLEGNYDGVFQASTGQLDPNINSAYDYADFMVNTQGFLSNDRENAIKLDGSYLIQKGVLKDLNLGASFHWFSGFPLTAYGYSFAYANWEYYLSPRGSLGRSPADWEINAHFSYPIKLGPRAKAEGIVDVFNLLNRQALTQYDQRYNLVQDGSCGGIPSNICNGDGGIATQPGTLTPLGVLSDPKATATNPDFLKKGTNFTGQRSVRIGFRISF